jgi:hypothetical protein
MAIIEFSFDRNRAPSDAVGVLLGFTGTSYVDGKYIDTVGPRAYWVWKTHVGLCLKDREMNGYDDSDFYMTIWDEEKQAPREIMFASTRGWTYPSYGSAVDATDEVRAKYDAWIAARREESRVADRKAKVLVLRKDRKIIRETVGGGDAFVRAIRLRRHLGAEKFNSVIKLLNTKVRSSFKRSLQDQVVRWFKEGSDYKSPLSPKQLDCLTQYETQYRRYG